MEINKAELPVFRQKVQVFLPDILSGKVVLPEGSRVVGLEVSQVPLAVIFIVERSIPGVKILPSPKTQPRAKKISKKKPKLPKPPTKRV